MVRKLVISVAAFAMLAFCVADVQAGLFGRAYGCGYQSSCCYSPVVYTSHNYHNYYGGWGGCGYGGYAGYGWGGYGHGWGGYGCGTGCGWGGYTGYGWGAYGHGWGGYGCGTGCGWGGYAGHGWSGYGWGGYGHGCCAAVDQKQNAVSDNAYVNVSVPADAKIWVNGYKTTTEGAKRRFESRNLTADKDYTFEVRAQVNQNGRQIEQTQQVTIQSGQTKSLAFDFDTNANPVATLTSN